MRAHESRGDTRLTDENPAFVTCMEEGREHIAMTIERLLSHGCVIRVDLFIARLRTSKANHRVTLWGDESRCTLWQTEGGLLLFDDRTSGLIVFLSLDGVLEGNVIVLDEEGYYHLMLLGVSHCDVKTVSLEVDM